MTRRLAQNFAGRHALIVSDDDLDVLTSALARIGVKSTRILGGADMVRDIVAVLRPETDILIIDAEGNAAAEMAAGDHGALASIPILGLIGGESPSRLKILMHLGATALIRKPIHGASIYPALFLAANEHGRRLSLEGQVAEFERRRHGRRAVMKAVLHRMMTAGQSDDAAYEDLRREAMAARVPVEDYCEARFPSMGRFLASDGDQAPAKDGTSYKVRLRESGDDFA